VGWWGGLCSLLAGDDAVLTFVRLFSLCAGQTLDKCGGIDILVSNAAVNPFFGNILDSTEEVWDKVRDIFVNCIKKKIILKKNTKNNNKL